MFNPFKRKRPTFDERVVAAIDEINALIPELPRGVSFWMTWKPRPQLTLTRREDVNQTQLYP